MTNMETKALLNHFLNVRNTLLKVWETELENFSGRVNNALTANGSDSTPTFSTKSEVNISTKYTSEPNTTTILTVLTHPRSNETSSSTTNPNSSSEKTGTGTTSANDLTLSPQSTSRTRRARKATSRPSSSSA